MRLDSQGDSAATISSVNCHPRIDEARQHLRRRVPELVVGAHGNDGELRVDCPQKPRPRGCTRSMVCCLQHIGAQLRSPAPHRRFRFGLDVASEQNPGAAVVQAQDNRAIVEPLGRTAIDGDEFRRRM